MSDMRLLEDYITRAELAVELDCCTRTIARMENLRTWPDLSVCPLMTLSGHLGRARASHIRRLF